MVPVELLKCRAQVTLNGKLNYPAEIRSVLSEQGVRGLYRGFWMTACRDVPGWGSYFWTYEWLKEKGDKLFESEDTAYEEMRWREFLWNINAGGVAGIASWVVSIP